MSAPGNGQLRTMPHRRTLREAVQGGRPLLGMFMFTGSPPLVEILGRTGFDFVIVDVEHSVIAIEETTHLVRAAESAGVIPLVRVPELRPYVVGKALDTGISGIIFSHIHNRAEAEEAVRLCKYPPAGDRSMCTAIRSSWYASENWSDYQQRANDDLMVIALIEDREAVNNMDEIAAVPGIDVLFVGPGDLSQSVGAGHLGHGHPAVEAATRRSAELARQHGKVAMSVPYPSVTPGDVRGLVDMGVQLVAYSIDERVFYNACQAATRELRPILDSQPFAAAQR
jgi:2-keto-3-deoxy-L-rhamnonate aldolase RhmA